MHEPLALALGDVECKLQVLLKVEDNCTDAQIYLEQGTNDTCHWLPYISVNMMHSYGFEKMTKSIKFDNANATSLAIDTIVDLAYAKITHFMRENLAVKQVCRDKNNLMIKLGLDSDFFAANKFYSANVLDLIFSLVYLCDPQFALMPIFPITLNLEQAIFPVKYFYPAKVLIEPLSRGSKTLFNVLIYNKENIEIALLKNISLSSYCKQADGEQFADFQRSRTTEKHSMLIDLDDDSIV